MSTNDERASTKNKGAKGQTEVTAAKPASGMALLDALRRQDARNDLPDFRVGDTVMLSVRITEGEKSRLQAFEGVVIAQQGTGKEASITVRKISSGVAVERIVPLCSPNLSALVVKKQGRVRRAKLFYLRGKTGRKARIREKVRG